MILRGSAVSEQARPLPARPHEELVAPLVDAKVERSDSDGMRLLESALPGPVGAPEPLVPALAFEDVVAWLVVQDEETRKSCSSLLSSELTEIHEKAREQGREAGRAEALAAAKVAAEAELELLRNAVAGAARAFETEHKQLADLCVEVIAEAFGKLAGRSLVSEDAIRGAVLQVLQRVTDERELTIRVARDDVALLSAHQDVLVEALSGRKFQILADSRVELGGCIVETKLGSLDGRLEVQLRELFETLKLARAGGPEAQ